MTHILSINNKKVYDFYNTRKNISFEDMSVMMVDMLKKIEKNTDHSIDYTFAEKVLGSITNLDSKLKNIDESMAVLFENKFTDFKKSYTEELNNILNNANNEKTASLLREYNENLQDKTKLLFNEFFPKNNEVITNQINNSFNIFDKLINATEARLQNTITETKNNLSCLNTINNTQNTISENINNLINKFHGSSTKGYFSEVSIVDGLTAIYPYGNVEHVGNKLNNSCDIILNRKDKPKILIENKEYDDKIPQPEIKKFIDNVVLNNCDGIMISQHTQITFKDDFEINFNGDLILVYICNMGYNMDKVRTAISIIDHLKTQLDFVKKDKTCISLDEDEINKINTEYNFFINQKKFLIKSLNDSHTKHIKEIDNMKMPTIQYILMKKYGVKLTDDVDCKYCGKPCKNAAGISAHLKTCKQFKLTDEFKLAEEKEPKETKKQKKKNENILEIT